MGRCTLLEKWKIAIKRYKVGSNTSLTDDTASSVSSEYRVPGETDLEEEVLNHRLTNTSRRPKSCISARCPSWQISPSQISTYVSSTTYPNSEPSQSASMSPSQIRKHKPHQKSVEIVEMCRKLVKRKKNKSKSLICETPSTVPKITDLSPKPSASGPCAGWKLCETNFTSKELRKLSKTQLSNPLKPSDLPCIGSFRIPSVVKLARSPGPSRTNSIRSVTLDVPCTLSKVLPASSSLTQPAQTPHITKYAPVPKSKLNDNAYCLEEAACNSACNGTINRPPDKANSGPFRLFSFGDIFPRRSGIQTLEKCTPTNVTETAGISPTPNLTNESAKCNLTKNRDVCSETLRTHALVPKPLFLYLKDLFECSSPKWNATVLFASLLFVLLIGLWVGFVCGHQRVDTSYERLRRRTRTCPPSTSRRPS